MSRYVYVIRNKVNGKVYVGQSAHPEGRFYDHLKSAKHGNRRPLYCAIRKYGDENFDLDVIEECITSELTDEREVFWIAHYCSTDREKGYNIYKGGAGFTDEHRAKLSRALIGNKRSAGKPVSAETRAKLSARHKGRPIRPEVREKMSRAAMGRKGPVITQEVRGVISRKLRKLSDEQLDEIIRRNLTGESLKELSCDFGVSAVTIARSLRMYRGLVMRNCKVTPRE